MLAVACVLLCRAGAVAQIASPADQNPLTPTPESDPKHPPRFEKRPPSARPGAGATFTPPQPASGAGATGFDSSNSRKAKAKTARKPAAAAQAIAPGPPAPEVVSPYQKPPKFTDNDAFASAPASPQPDPAATGKLPKKHKAHTEPDDPYAALGIRSGGLTYFPAIEILGGYNSNPSQATGGKGAAAYTIAPELLVKSDWSRHEFKAELRGSYNGFSPDETPTLSRPYFNGKVDGRVDVTKLTRIDLGARVLVSTDNPNSPDLPANLSKLPIFTTFGGSAGIGQKFNRFDVSVKGDAERTVYQDSSLTDGTTSSNEDRNYNQFGGTVRGGYELTPGVTPFLEGGADTRHHDLAVDAFGYERDSKGVTGKAGTTFELSRLLTGEVALGFTRRDYEDPRLESIKGLIGDASLVWTRSALTTVKLTAKSAVSETTLAGVSGVLNRDVGLEISHSLRRWLVGSVKLGVGFDSYVGDVREDKRYSAGVGLTYKLNRTVQLKGEFRQDWLHSNVAGNDYTASTVMFGLRFQQ